MTRRLVEKQDAVPRKPKGSSANTNTVTPSIAKTSLAKSFEIVGWKNTSLTAQLLDATHIGVQFKTLMGNEPLKFGNVISVWSGNQIGWRTPKPVVSVPVPKNTPAGDMIIDLGNEPPPGGPPYMVAYGTSGSGTAYCAAQVAATDDQPSVTTQLCLPWVGTDSLLAAFLTPQGNLPATYGNWIGLWPGQSVRYDGVNLIKKVNVTGDGAQGSQDMNGLTLTVNTLYTLGYACGPRNEDLAAFITFKTEPFLLQFLRSLFRIKSRNSA